MHCQLPKTTSAKGSKEVTWRSDLPASATAWRNTQIRHDVLPEKDYWVNTWDEGQIVA
jgi:hypothetical protein